MGIGRLVGGEVARVGLDALGDLDGLRAGLVEVGPVTGGYASHQRAAEGAAFFGDEYFDGKTVDAGLDAPPQFAARAAAAEADIADGNAELGKEGEGVFERVGDAFEHSADEVAGGMAGVDARKGCANVWVEVRRALAKQVGRPHEALAAGGNFFCLRVEGVVILAGEERFLEPAQAEAGALGNAHDVPEAGNGVAEGMQAALRVFGGLGSGCEDNTGGADGGGDRAGLENAHADGSCALIAGAGGYGRAGFEAGERCGFFADAGADFW